MIRIFSEKFKQILITILISLVIGSFIGCGEDISVKAIKLAHGLDCMD